MAADIPSEGQILEWMTSLSNWGRWGDDDQIGCLNLITPEKRRQAASLILDGGVVSCARPITTEMAPDITYQVQRYMVDSGEGRDTDTPERRRRRRGAAEFIGMVFHGQGGTVTLPDSSIANNTANGDNGGALHNNGLFCPRAEGIPYLPYELQRL